MNPKHKYALKRTGIAVLIMAGLGSVITLITLLATSSPILATIVIIMIVLALLIWDMYIDFLNEYHEDQET